MKFRNLHPWHVTPQEGMEIQKRLAFMVVKGNGPTFNKTSTVAGVDVSFTKGDGWGYAAVVVMGFPSLEVLDLFIHKDRLEIPYIPGLLSFREAPLMLKALEKIQHIPQIIIVDGNGIAHPRRFGIASHIGVLTEIPTIGCAKSKLLGRHGMPGLKKGSWVPWVDEGEVIGAVVRTRDGINPVYVSIGHLISLRKAIEITLACCSKFRLPEPIREAHKKVNQARREDGSRR